MPHLISLVILLAATALTGSAHARETRTTPRLPADVVVPKDVQLPTDVAIAMYAPAKQRRRRVFLPQAGFWLEPGKALENSLAVVHQQFFSGGFLAEPSSEQPYGLLLVIHPQWQHENGSIRMTMHYKVFGVDNSQLLAGKQTSLARLQAARAGGEFYAVAVHTAQLVAAEIVSKLLPGASKYPATGKLAAVDPQLIVNREEPAATGTGFFINELGQVVTAAHVVEECVITEVTHGDRTLSARSVASSRLLDLAVLDTSTSAERFLPLRKGAEIILGEPVVNVGFPLQSILVASPNLTRGNVSSRGALEGAVGQFQFSAPIQPGSSGGPVVSDGGELLGITVSTLNVGPLIERGVLPQNVNFALDARYAAMFLRRNNITFTEVEPNPQGDMRTGNEAALSAVVRLACYQ